MQIVYKLTDAKGQTYGGLQWGEGVSHRAHGKGMTFCSPDLIHAYSHPLLAVLLNPIHGNFQAPLLWKAKGVVKASDDGLKLGLKQLTTIHQIPVPQITTTQHIAFGFLAALEVYLGEEWVRWVHNWLDGNNRSSSTARAAVYATYAAVHVAKAAANAAKAAALSNTPLNLIALAKQAMLVE